MKVLILGLGLQGKAVIHDLEQSASVSQITAADIDVDKSEAYVSNKGYRKVRVVAFDASQPEKLKRLIRETGPDVLVCMLPADFQPVIARTAIDESVSYVSSSYAGTLTELNDLAVEKGVTVLPEMGLDPGIDLILGRLCVDELDQVHGMRSYGAGVPDPESAADNPIHYKISWTFEGVLKAYMRPARFLKNGKEGAIPEGQILRKENRHVIEVPGLGSMDAYYNGDALRFIEVFGLGPDLKEMGRFAMRWPGHNEFWNVMAGLGFLDETPLRIGGAEISPRRFVAEHLKPRLQFQENEKDVVVVRVEAWGLKDGRPLQVIHELVDFRDLETGFFAMNRTVGFTASIAAQMVLEGKIRKAGVLSPVRDVPHQEVLRELENRGIKISRREKWD